MQLFENDKNGDLQGQKPIAQGKRSAALGRKKKVKTRPERAKALYNVAIAM